MINQKLIEQIQKDIDNFELISTEEQIILINSLTSQWIKLTDSLFEWLAKESNIDNIKKYIDLLLPFLLRMWNFLISWEKININDLLNNLKFSNSKTSENLEKLFNSNSNFLKSIECEYISNENTNVIEIYNSINQISELKYWEFLINSKINIKMSNKDIELILNIEELEKLRNSIEQNIEDIKKFKEDTIKNININIFK